MRYGHGADRMLGGAGNDKYYVDSTSDRLSEGTSTDKADAIYSTISVNIATAALGAGQIERVFLQGTKAINATGSSFDNTITGNAAANKLEGVDGNDWLRGGGGNDQLFGGAGNDILDGGAGDDKLVSGAGVDLLIGGQGNDRYILDSTDVKIDEGTFGDIGDFADINFDTDFIDLNTFGGGAIENVSFTGSFGVGCGGNGANNEMTGTGGGDTLDGAGGDDHLIGIGGDDDMSGGNQNDTLEGGDGNDNLNGGTGDDVLIAGFGAFHTLSGGLGADRFQFELGASFGDNVVSDYALGEGDVVDLSNLLAGTIPVLDLDNYIDLFVFFNTVTIQIDTSGSAGPYGYLATLNNNADTTNIVFKVGANLVTYNGAEFELA